MPPTQLRVVAVWWIACLLWSGTYLFIRLGLADIPPLTFAWVRLGIALGVLVPLAVLDGSWRSATRLDVLHVSAAGIVLLGVNYALVFWGAQFVPSGLVAILQSTTPVLALTIGWALGSERPTLRKVFAQALGIIGVIIIFGAESRAAGSSALLGSGAVFAGAGCVALAYAWLKSRGTRLRPISIAALQSAAASVPLSCLAFFVEGGPAAGAWRFPAWAALLYLALCASVLAFWLNYWLLARMDTSRMLLMGVAEVPIAITLGAIVFGERLPSGTLVGGLCVLTGVTVGLLDVGAASRPCLSAVRPPAD